MNHEEDDDHLKTQKWNAYEKKSNVTLYVLIGILCFLIAWVISGAAY